MMRPMAVALAPLKADTITWVITGSGNNRRFTISWNDNSINETGFVLQRSVNGSTWTNVGTVSSPIDPAVPNIHQPRSLTDASSNVNTPYLYRVVAQNTVGYGGAYPSMTAQSISDPVAVGTLPTAAPAAPTNLAVSLQAGPQANLTWRDNATNESGFVIERAVAGSGVFTQVGVAPARTSTGNTSFADTTIQPGVAYEYRVAAVNLFGGVPTLSAWSNVASTTGAAAAPAAPTNFAAASGAEPGHQADGRADMDRQRHQRDRVHRGAGHKRRLHDRPQQHVGGGECHNPQRDRAQQGHHVLLPDPGEQRDHLVRLGQRRPVPHRHQPVTFVRCRPCADTGRRDNPRRGRGSQCSLSPFREQSSGATPGRRHQQCHGRPGRQWRKGRLSLLREPRPARRCL